MSWEAVRVKYLCAPVDRRAGESELPLLSVSAYRGVVPRSEITDDLPRAEDLSNYKVCAAGDIVLNRMSAYQGAVGVTRHAGLVSPDYLVLRPTRNSDPGYLHHLFRSHPFVGEMTSRLRGIGDPGTGSVRTPRINVQDLGEIWVRLPSLAEQRRIADFLDAETRRIDSLVSLRSRQRALVRDRLVQLIDGATVAEVSALNELGIAAGGEWRPVKVSHLCQIVPGFAFASDKYVDLDSGTRLLRGINVGVNRIDWTEAVAWDASANPVSSNFRLTVGDLVVGMDRPWIKEGMRLAIVGPEDLPALLLQRVACLRPRRSVDTGFLQLVLRSSHFRYSVESELTGVSVPHLSADQIGSFRFNVPPIEVQHRIGQAVDAQERALVRLNEGLERQVDKLMERREALIAAAVTGQFDVTTARGADLS